MTKFKGLLIGVSCAAIVQGFPALAQQADSDAVAETVADDGRRLDTVTVNATRRAASIQDVPIAVTALDRDSLERAGIGDITDLPALSASFNMSNSNTQSGGSTLRIRGVGTTGNNVGLEGAVGVFLDGVYLSRPGVALGDLVDLDQIEVLRGPQGTLFGRNTSAGALSIRTKKPNLEEAEGFGNLTVGNYQSVNVQAGVSLPLVADKLAVRVSGAINQRDGFMDSSDPNNPDGSLSQDRWMVRGQLYAEPSDNVNIRVIVDHSDTDDLCCDAVHLSPSALLQVFPLAGLPANGGAPVVGFDDALDELTGNSLRFEDPSEQTGISAELNWDLGESNLTYIGSYREFESLPNIQESDFVSLDVFSVGGSTATTAASRAASGNQIDTMSHELRLQGTAFNDRLDWLVGAYYSEEDIQNDAVLTTGADYQAYAGARFLTIPGIFQGFGGNPLLAMTASPANPQGVSSEGNYAHNRFLQSGESFSVFTHNVFSVTDKLDLTLGLRYIDESKDGSFDQVDANSPACQAIIGNVVGGSIPANLAGGAVALTCFANVAPADLPTSALLPTPRTYDETFEDEELVYTLKASYALSDDVNAYASISHGFKSGGFNLDPSAAVVLNTAAIQQGIATNTPVAPVFGDPSFDSEKVDSYELGIKADLLDGRARINAAAFVQELEDFQVLEFTGVQFVTFNVPTVESRGVEVEGQYLVTPDFALNGAVTYTDADYPDDCDDGVPTPTVSLLCGNSLTNAPDWVVLLGGQYSRDLTDAGHRGFLSASARYESDRRTSTQALLPDGSLNPFDIQGDNTKIDLRAGITSPDETWTFEVWGKNITDEITRSVTFNIPLSVGARGGFTQDPATYGVTLRYKH